MYLNQIHPLTQNETTAVLWLLVVLIGAVVSLIIAFWNQSSGKWDSLDEKLSTLLINSHGHEKDIESLKKADDRFEEKVDHIDGRILALEQRRK